MTHYDVQILLSGHDRGHVREATAGAVTMSLHLTLHADTSNLI